MQRLRAIETWLHVGWYWWSNIVDGNTAGEPLNLNHSTRHQVPEDINLYFETFLYLLTYSVVQSPSWEVNGFAGSQEIPPISRNPKVHYHTHKRPPPVSILGQNNPVHLPTSHLLEIHPNIIHPSTPWSPQLSPSLRFPQKDPIHPPLLTHTRHMPSPSHSSRFYHPHNIRWEIQIIWLLVMQSPPFPRKFSNKPLSFFIYMVVKFGLEVLRKFFLFLALFFRISAGTWKQHR